MQINSPLAAIRSLITPHHAENIEPKILNVTWFIGKRCNYDCSYCPTAIHDLVSDHLPVPIIKNFLEKLNSYCQAMDKTYRISITGGEPCVHPRILDILELMCQHSNSIGQMVLTSNGSLPVVLYEKSLRWLSHLTISLHLERSESELLDTLEKIRYLTENSDKRITAQVTCLPGKFDFIENHLKPFFEKHQIKNVFRKIRPATQISMSFADPEIAEKMQGKDRETILRTKFPLEFQGKYREFTNKLMADQLGDIYKKKSYYSDEEIKYFEENNVDPKWENIGVYFENNEYIATNSDTLANHGLNNFKGWHCFAGIDNIAIEVNGTVYRAGCGNEGPIGSIFGEINFPKEHTVCNQNWCTMNGDQTIRKARPNYVHLITNSTRNQID